MDWDKLLVTTALSRINEPVTVLASLLLLQLNVREPWNATEDGPSVWALLITHKEDLDGIPWLRACAWLVPADELGCQGQDASI